ncbi:U5 snRNP-specific protein-like factor [Terfezia boudieri ATCC MYA-4762]|uniref:U5 snRNP-specific protein-like factor n=1 Tax=Terfezia boudieri ATCC MYA-4762 TaxID=1051890 RepID=A0A3N4M418_9PEZI|nr:U5 snRNP-specific protein-like factor [Terfezia boudieri ATCC MYA-4762]
MASSYFDPKRKVPEGFGAATQLVKRVKTPSERNEIALRPDGSKGGALIQAVPRTSGLQAPIMELTGHSGDIFAVRFDPTGQNIASGSMDRTVMLWRTYGECENYVVLSGHKGAILDLNWSRDSLTIFTASADSLLASWDVDTKTRIRRYVGHEDIVNVMDITRRGPEMIVSGSDDGTIGIWDPRQKSSVDYLETNFPVTAVAVSDAGNELFTGGIDNDIKVWDLRKLAIVYLLRGHQDTITSLSVSPDGQSLLSNSMDNSVRIWDIRAFAPTNRLSHTFAEGVNVGIEKNLIRASWSPQGNKVAAGSGDRTVAIWDVESKKMLYKLPGHRGSVNDVRFSPMEPIIVSGSTDRTILLGEIAK